jgi:hypothetical protein
VFAAACGGGGQGPRTEAEAIEWARVTLPAQSSDLHYFGDKGIDFSVELQFVVPSGTDLEPLYAEIGCTPISGGTPHHGDPFGDNAVAWYIKKAGYPTVWCITDAEPIDEHRSIRVIAQDDGSTVVQVQVYGY